MLRCTLIAFVMACGAPAQPVTARETVPTNQQDEGRWKTSPQGPPLPADAVFDHGDDARAVYKVRLPYEDLLRDYTRYLPTVGFTPTSERMTGVASTAVIDATDATGGVFMIVLSKETENTTQIELARTK